MMKRDSVDNYGIAEFVIMGFYHVAFEICEIEKKIISFFPYIIIFKTGIEHTGFNELMFLYAIIWK